MPGRNRSRFAEVCLVCAIAVAVILSSPVEVRAHSYKLGDISIGHVWATPPENGDSGVAVYGPILNGTDEPLRLLGASTPIADEVRFRVSKNSAVRWPEFIELDPGKPLALAPWREHIWLSGLEEPLKEGDSFGLSLDFGGKGAIAITVVVEGAGGH